MTDNTEAPEGRESFEEHPLYQTAMKRMARGDVEDAGAKLSRLVELYPDEQELRDLAVRVQLMGALADSSPGRADHGSPAPLLRNALLILLVVTLIVVGVAGFAAAYDRFVRPTQANKEQEVLVQSVRQDCKEQLQAGYWSGAQACFEELLTMVPGDPTAQAGIEQSRAQEELDRLYTDAVTYEQQGDGSRALDVLRQLEAMSPGYRDVAQRIKVLESLQALETSFSEAQNLVQAGDRQGAISLLVQIRAENPGFRRSQVEALLFQAYTEEARQLISQANGDPNVLRQALGYLDKALALRPADRDLLRERTLAQDFVQGAEAYAQGDWVGAVTHWEAVNTAQPDYQGGIVRDPLQQTYPKAADQLIDQAYGDAGLLRQAIGYLDKALATQPGNQSLIDKRRLAAEYVAGADAAAGERWNEAITHWGAIYAVQPDYQHGVLEDRLRQVCANSPTPSTDLCPP
jgi:tetratricopeptide (TPR) repeat protein